MDSNRFQLAERLFHEAMAQAPGKRRSFIDEAVGAVGGDHELAERVRRLIDFAQAAAPPSLNLGEEIRQAMTSADRLVGATIGRYRITKLIGEGGFGAVYQAEQEEPVQRTVALKILKRGMDSEQVIARFEAERQALAMMEHPNVARVFDAGQTDESSGSRPYFVMEFVPGEPMTQYCNARKLPVQARLELFIAVCHAVQHAHHKGMIHRDLKPSNILVTEIDGAAAPKIIDFGIAKALAHPIVEGAAVVTQRLELLGTPQYMSPEQIDDAGKAIDTRSDIYSLGVVLYEVLTGATPLQLPQCNEVSYSRVQALMRETTVEKPSQRVLRADHQAGAAPARMNMDPNALSRRLRGDLDWILLKALETDRDRRYSSASAFADDIIRHLENRPVVAGPPSAAYRVRKFVRRHRAGVLAAALVALAIVGGISATALAMLRAQDAAAQAKAINDFMREVLTSPDPERQGADVRLVNVLGEASERATTQFAGHPGLEAEVRELLGLVYAKLWRMNEAIAEFRRCMELRQERFGPDHVQTLEVQVMLGKCYGSVRRLDDLEALTADLLPRAQRVLGDRHLVTAMAENFAGRVDVHRGRVMEGEQQLRATLSWVTKTFARASEIRCIVLESVYEAVRAHMLRATVNSESAERWLDELEQLATELRDVELERSGPTAIATFVAEVRLADVSRWRKRTDETIERAQAILDRSAQILSECHSVRIKAKDQLASALRLQGEIELATQIMLERSECSRSALGASPIVVMAEMSDLMPYLDHSGRWEQGESIARELVAKFQGMDQSSLGPMTCNPELYLARFLSHQGRLEEARPLLQKWLANEPLLSDQKNSAARLHMFHAGYLVKLERFAEAEAELQRAQEILGDPLRGTWTDHPDDVLLEYIALHEAWGKPEKAAEYRQLRQQVLVPSKRTKA